ncbi:MAG: hypothetical protein RL721_2210 [Candidatus Eisenbacteria bacterium]
MNPFLAVPRRLVAVLAALALLSAALPSSGLAQAAKPAATKPAATKSAPKAKKAKAPAKTLEQQIEEDGLYAKGTNWVSARFGWNDRTGERNGDGLYGYGIGYQRMMSPRYAFAAGVSHDIVGRFGDRHDVMVPMTAEFQRHFRWKGALRPYVGAGGGYYFRKLDRTANDHDSYTTSGAHLSLGFTSTLDASHLIGLEVRAALLNGRPGLMNPTFGAGTFDETVWSVKASYAFAYR